jgi:hypothetical protein
MKKFCRDHDLSLLWSVMTNMTAQLHDIIWIYFQIVQLCDRPVEPGRSRGPGKGGPPAQSAPCDPSAGSGKVRQQIEEIYLKGALQPPYFKELTDKFPGHSGSDVLQVMVKDGILIKVKEDLFFTKT